MLFKKSDLDTQLNKRREEALHIVDNISEEKLQASNFDKLINRVIVSLKVENITLKKKEISDPQETQVDVSDRPGVRILSPNNQLFVSGHKVVVKIPFKGDEWIFKYMTNPSVLRFPEAEVHNGNLIFEVVFPEDENPESFTREVNDQINLIKEHLTNANKQINFYNERLSDWIWEAVKNRLDRMKHKQERQEEIKNSLKSI